MAEVKITTLEGDGIGSRQLIDGQPGPFTDFVLPGQLDSVVDAINGQLDGDHSLALEFFDLSLEARMEALTPEAVQDYYGRLVEQVLLTDGRFIKMPTTTATPDEARAVMAENTDRYRGWSDDEKAAYVAMHTKSPNAKIRGAMDLNVMERPSYSSVDLASAPRRFSDMHVMTPELEIDFLGGEPGNFNRVFPAGAIETFAGDLLLQAAETGKDILVTTKNTISPLDAKFLDSIRQAAKKDERFFFVGNKEDKSNAHAAKQAGKIIISPWLFDSFLPAILRDGHSEKIIACLPDQADMISGLQEISGNTLEGSIENIPPRVVCRVPKGSGYGEKYFDNESDGFVGETHTIPESDLRKTALRAAEAAKQLNTKPVLVLPVDRSPVNAYLFDSVLDVLGADGFVAMSLSDIMAELAKNPNNSELMVFITTNQLGDYLSDFLPQIHYGALDGAKTLGAGENLNISTDESGDIRFIGTDPSTGTAPDLISVENIGKILPAGALLSLATLLIEDSRLPDELKVIGQRLRGAILETLVEQRNFDVHTDFTSEVIRKLAA